MSPWPLDTRDSTYTAPPSKVGRRGYTVHEEPGEYRTDRNDPDTDPDAEVDRE